MKFRLSNPRLLALSALCVLIGWSAAPASAFPPPVDAGFVMFRGASFPIQENDGHVDVIVRRHRGGSGVVTVDVATVDGSAIAGGDYTATTATLTWADGDRADRDRADGACVARCATRARPRARSRRSAPECTTSRSHRASR
mgnify:CR=1 FL=1